MNQVDGYKFMKCYCEHTYDKKKNDELHMQIREKWAVVFQSWKKREP
jgi:hypothetical protein